ncbi:DNA adenine methylase [Latilactobacillus sakei]|uniref:DNA adenine methylase n=1 Tax=Latilactobacillus sakei TaxID=1599 RepID=UPI001157F237|nr:DNA adenine methylase [Latilactobacillus sakei]VTU51876.1 hypothetical protein (plasmid) [Lactobacillus johnsonii] [Latilactobacillus sakei]
MFPRVNYIGNKNKIVDWIISGIPSDVHTVIDGFAGGGSVAYSLKENGYSVIANDILYSSFVVNKALIENDEEIIDIDELGAADNYSISNKVSKRLEFLAEKLYFPSEVEELAKLISYAEENLTGYKYWMFLALLRRAMIRKLPYSRMNLNWENIVKLRDEQYSYAKYGRKRAYHNNSFISHMLDALDEYNLAVFKTKSNIIVEQLDIVQLLEKYPTGDLLYLDPPYPGTMNNYDGFYGAFDLMFDKKNSHINLTSQKDFLDQMHLILKNAQNGYKYAMISLNNSIKPSFTEFSEMISHFGKVSIFDKKHNYQVSGSDTKQKNIELLALIEFDKNTLNKEFLTR